MADDTVIIRYEPTGEEREVAPEAVPFFPGWTVPNKADAKAVTEAAKATPQKEN